MERFTTLIIDDEQIARERLKRLLPEFEPVFQLIGEAKNGEEGLAMVEHLKPDLIFLDIQMPGKTGFEMLQEMNHLPIIIFCTAYEEYALKAFNTVALDYLVKPVEKERLKLTVEKLGTKQVTGSSKQIKELLELIQQQSKPKTIHSIPHKIGDRVILIKPEQITHFVANEKYVDFYTKDGKKYISDISLKKLEDTLPGNFTRIQRSTIVNVEHIKEFRKYFRGKYVLVIDDVKATKIETGRSYAQKILQLIQIE
ncbi:LytR/AlgR family response regulator transcription factor [Maribellus sediminis]|uniref:LytR/AlgR family response regulator transcription factor n=1 Tax=Maribellus sediminis TaxID=2696285 RepID=UPI0014319DED|nr:LytTR family DNA-binding domain-containing protein [Maribellus sediminis]